MAETHNKSIDRHADTIDCETLTLEDVDDVVVVHRHDTLIDTCQQEIRARVARDDDTRKENELREEMEELLNSDRCDRYRLQRLCEANDNKIPPSCRRRAWAVLLGVEGLLHARDGLLDADLATTAENLINQRVVTADVDRTRQTIDLFRTSVVKDSAVRILTFYCKRKERIYRQGMNEILAPFLLLAAQEEGTGSSASNPSTGSSEPDGNAGQTRRGLRDESGTFNMFYAFLTRQLPNMFRDGFHSLQYLLRCLGLLLQFHDPELAKFLEQHDIGQPALYATSWILTAFSHDLPMPTLLALWDTYILEESPLLHLFVSLAWLLHFRQQFLSANSDSAHDVVTTMRDTLRLLDERQIMVILRNGRKLMSITPPSFRAHVSNIVFNEQQGNSGPSASDLLAIESVPAVMVSAADAAMLLTKRAAEYMRKGAEPFEAMESRSSSSSQSQDNGRIAKLIIRRLVALLNTPVVVDTRPAAVFVKRHLKHCSYLHPKFLQKLHQQNKLRASGENGVNLSKDLHMSPYAQRLVQTLFAELTQDSTRAIYVVGDGSPKQSEAFVAHQRLLQDPKETAPITTPHEVPECALENAQRLRAAVEFLVHHQVSNVCVINGGFEHLDQALKSNNTIVRFLNHYATTSATESPVLVTTNDLFETRGRLDATLVRVEDAIDAAAEVAAAAVGKAAHAMEQNIVAGASEIRHGVSSAARSVSSSISRLTNWLGTEWKDGHDEEAIDETAAPADQTATTGRSDVVSGGEGGNSDATPHTIATQTAAEDDNESGANWFAGLW